MKKINVKKILIFFVLVILVTLLKSSELKQIQTIDQLFLIIFNYINKNNIIDVYNDFIYILPYSIIYFFCIKDIKPYFENKDMLIVRFISMRENILFLSNKVLITVFKYVLLYALSIIIVSLFYGFKLVSISNIILILVNLILIEIISILFYWLLSNLIPDHYAFLVSTIMIFLIPITGFLGIYINNTNMHLYNPMIVNTIFTYELPVHIELNYINHLIWIVVIYVCVLYTFYFKEV